MFDGIAFQVACDVPMKLACWMVWFPCAADGVTAVGVRGAPRKACPPGHNLKDSDHDGFPDVYVGTKSHTPGVRGRKGACQLLLALSCLETQPLRTLVLTGATTAPWCPTRSSATLTKITLAM